MPWKAFVLRPFIIIRIAEMSFILKLAGQFSLQCGTILCIFLNTDEIRIVYTWHLLGQMIFAVVKWIILSRDKKKTLYYLGQHDSTSYLLTSYKQFYYLHIFYYLYLELLPCHSFEGLYGPKSKLLHIFSRNRPLFQFIGCEYVISNRVMETLSYLEAAAGSSDCHDDYKKH